MAMSPVCAISRKLPYIKAVVSVILGQRDATNNAFELVTSTRPSAVQPYVNVQFFCVPAQKRHPQCALKGSERHKAHIGQ